MDASLVRCFSLVHWNEEVEVKSNIILMDIYCILTVGLFFREMCPEIKLKAAYSYHVIVLDNNI